MSKFGGVLPPSEFKQPPLVNTLPEIENKPVAQLKEEAVKVKEPEKIDKMDIDSKAPAPVVPIKEAPAPVIPIKEPEKMEIDEKVKE